MRQYDIICGNPPFQDTVNRKKTQHKIWIEFTLKAEEQLKEGGYLTWITPQSWGSPSNKILSLFQKSEVKNIDMDIASYFPGVGSTFSGTVLRKSSTGRHMITTFRNKGRVFDSRIDDSVKWIPNDFCRESISIHSKVMFSEVDKFPLGYDYVTCHNILRHSLEKHDEKIEKKLQKLKETEKGSIKEKKAVKEVTSLIQERANVKQSLSEVKTDDHIYPVFHTNNKVWYSSCRQDFADSKKVMWSRSGYTKPFYDSGNFGCTDMGYYIKVGSETQGRNLEKFLSSDLMKYIFRTAKWSGFGNEIVFSSIPKVPLEKSLGDCELYDYFNLTDDEVLYLQAHLSGKTRSASPKPKVTESPISSSMPERVKAYGEVFTPTELVDKMLDSVPRGLLEDCNASVIDPACGNGNFILQVIDRRYKATGQLDRSIESVYGIDILEDNIEDLKHRIEDKYSDQFRSVEHLVNKNFVVGNFLKGGQPISA